MIQIIKRRTAVIIGCNGQDGTLLGRSLVSKGVETFGISRKQVLQMLENNGSKIIREADGIIFNQEKLMQLVLEIKPTEIYYLAARHSSSEGYQEETAEEYCKSNDTHVIGLINILNAIKLVGFDTRLFYASSALVFAGNLITTPTTESSLIAPVGYYGLTKAQGVLMCRYYRARYDMHISVGHLFNHESHLRPGSYLSKKVIAAAYNISKGNAAKLVVGHLENIVDWGYAPDFVEAFQEILHQNSADDFIVATGEGRSVLEFVSKVFECFRLDYREYLLEDASIVRRKSSSRIGDPSKLFRMSNWRPTYKFNSMVVKLVDDYIADLG